MVDRIVIGNVEIVSAIDMVPPPREPTVFIPCVPRKAWGPYEDEVLENGLLQLYYGCFYVRSEGKTILIDTGMGPGPHPHLGNKRGNLLTQLSHTGITPEDVDVVLHTHLHPDHVGWNVDYSSDTLTPYFPNARYLGPKLDWEYFSRPEILENARHITENVIPLDDLGLIEFIEGEHQVTGDITTFDTPGHTPGHQITLISSQGEKAAIIGDLIHNPVQIYEPDWCAGVDTNKNASRESREAFLKRAEHEDIIVAAGHFHPDRHFGKVVRLQGRRYWQVI